MYMYYTPEFSLHFPDNLIICWCPPPPQKKKQQQQQRTPAGYKFHNQNRRFSGNLFIVSQKKTQRYSKLQTNHFGVPPSPRKYKKNEPPQLDINSPVQTTLIFRKFVYSFSEIDTTVFKVANKPFCLPPSPKKYQKNERSPAGYLHINSPVKTTLIFREFIYSFSEIDTTVFKYANKPFLRTPLPPQI